MSWNRLGRTLVLALGAVAPAGEAAAQTTGLEAARAVESALVRAIEKAEASVVSIARIRPAPTETVQLEPLAQRPEPGSPDYVPSEYGSGVVIPGDPPDEPVVLTNYHVVRGGQAYGLPVGPEGSRLFVQFADRRGAYATIFAADSRSDLAVLRFAPDDAKALAAGLTPLVPAEAGRAKKGELLITLGNPYALARDGSASAGWGILSNKARRPVFNPLDPAEDQAAKPRLAALGTLWQIDGRLNLGMSGGAVLNLEGELVGISTALAAIEGYEKSGGFVTPFDAATLRIVQTLVRGQEVEYGFLGVSYSKAALPLPAQGGGQPRLAWGTRIENVLPNSPAHQGGLTRDDLITAVDGEAVYSGDDLMREVGLHPPGTSVPLTVSRGRRTLTLPVKLGKWPVGEGEVMVVRRPKFAPWRGLTVDYCTGRWKYMPSPERFQLAVLVAEVAPETRARPPLAAGDFVSHVNRTPVQTPAEFYAAVESLTGNVTLTLADGRTVVVSE